VAGHRRPRDGEAMDRLHENESILIGQELVSNNGWFRLRMMSTGGLELYRVQLGQLLWKSLAIARVGSLAAMQPDGSFVLRGRRTAPYWSTPTAGNPGAFVVLQNDGNLVVYDRNNRPLWASGSNPDLIAPTIRYTGEGGYTYNETSESWKQLCTAFPCFWALQWPGYATDVIEDAINGQAVVIQLWKGLCPKFLGFAGVQNFPGGVGAEVGVYRRMPGRVRPSSLPLPDNPFTRQIKNALQTLADNELWWAFPELGATTECTFINPVTGQPMFSAGPQTGYWLTKWMDENRYEQYKRDTGTSPSYTDYILEYRINGKTYPRWPADKSTAAVLAATALLLS
jgi:hypothetical protein